MQQEESSYQKKRERKYSSFNTETDPTLFFYLLRKNLQWIGLVIFICIISAYLLLRYTVPVYQSSLTFQVGSINTANQVLEVDNFYEKSDLEKEVEILKSKLLFKRAISHLPLDVTYFNKGKILNFELYKSSPIKVIYQIKDSSILGEKFYVKLLDNKTFELSENNDLVGKFKIGEKISTKKYDLTIFLVNSNFRDKNILNFNDDGLFFVINSLDNLTNSYVGNLSVIPLNVSAKTISISFQCGNAVKAKDIVSTIAEEYINYDIEERSKSSKKVLEFIDNQLQKYYNKLKLSESKIEDFQKSTNYKGTELSNVYLDRSSKLEDDIVDIDLQRNVLLEIQSAINKDFKNKDIYQLLPILAGTDYGSDISSLVSDLKELLVKKENLLFEVTDGSEAIKSIDHKINVQKNILFQSINSLISKFNNRKKESLIKVHEIESKYLNVPAKELEYARLQRVLSIDEKFFTMLMEKRTEYSISEAGFVSQHKILDKALIPFSPVSPNKRLFYFMGILIGFTLSLMMLIIKYILKNTITSAEEILKHCYSSVGILGIVPRYRYDIPVSQLVVNKNPKSIIAESFRSIRSNMQFITDKKGAKVMAITSTISGEGKTFCAINIAGIIAFSGKKVVILDLDMRKPKIHLGFGVSNQIGMSTLLIHKNTIQESIHHSELENLDFITSGPVPPNPSELIISGALDTLIEDLKKEYDYIIVDDPPIGLVSDAMETLKKADFPIYVFKNEYSKKYFTNNIDRLILDNGINKLSVILNSVEINKSTYGKGYGAYGYGNYGYGYGHGYYDDAPALKQSFIKKFFKNKNGI